jgi:hypothetical protein
LSKFEFFPYGGFVDMYYVTQQGSQWRFRQEGYVFPIKCGPKAEVLQFVEQYMKGHTGTVQISWEGGAVEQKQYTVKKRPS